jgi:uncharacterized protein
MLLALFDANHVHHHAASGWYDEHRNDGWATCAITENGFVRIMSRPGRSSRVSAPSAIAALRGQVATEGHEFWSELISITDPTVFHHERILGPNQITDVYLLALTVRNAGRLVTFDRAIPLPAVHGAEQRHLVVL